MGDLQVAVVVVAAVEAGRKAPGWCVLNPLATDWFVRLQVSVQAADELIYVNDKRANCMNLVYCSDAQLFGPIFVRYGI